jgi:biotin/methionine sulfoxide reductase
MVERIPHCAHWGAFWVNVEDGAIRGIEPFEGDPDPSPIIHAVKDWMDPKMRVAQPMVREGWLKAREKSDGAGRGSERMVPVSWEEASALVAGEIRRVSGEFGGASIFGGSYGWTSAGRFHHASTQMRRLLNLTGGYTGHRDTYSVAAGAVMLRHVFGHDGEYRGHGVAMDDVAENAEIVVAFGALTQRTSQNEAGGIARHLLGEKLRRLKARGVRVVLVSPRKDDAPDWLEADWWPIAPGTDTALLLGLAGEVLASNSHDRAFLERCCSGAEKFIDYVRGVGDGVPKDADWAAGLTGIEAGRIRRLARDLTALRSFISMSWSLQRAVHGEQPYWAAVSLAALVGDIGLPGGGVAFGFGSLGGVGISTTTGPSPFHDSGRNPTGSFIPVARITDLLEKPGEEFTYEGETRTYPDTRMVYWAGGNPFHHHQDLNRLSRAWTRPETIVVQEPLWTATAQRADILLPASTSLERNDISGNRRSDHLVAMKQCVAPLGQARSDYDICAGIAAELGLEAAFTEGRDEMAWLRVLYDQARDGYSAEERATMPDFDGFWQVGFVPVPTRKGYVHMAEFREDPAAHPLGTATGKIILHSDLLEDRAYPDCPPQATWLAPPEWLGAEGAERHPFHLISAQPQSKLHSQLAYSPVAVGDLVGGRTALSLHPDDAKALGLAEGDVALVSNDRGKCLAGVRFSAALRRSVALLPTGAWFAPRETPLGIVDDSGNPNVLTLDVPSSAFSGGCSAHTCLVSIEKCPAELLPAVAAE